MNTAPPKPRRLGALALSVCAAAIALGVALGCWQLARLQEKEALLARLAARLQAPAVVVQDIARGTPDAEWRAVQAQGIFLPGGTVLVGPRTRDGAAGVHVFTPLLLQDGGAVYINRGWLPATAGVPTVEMTVPEGEVRIEGVVRHAARGPFTPANDPVQNVWYWPDLDALRARGGDAVRGDLYIQQTAGGAGQWPAAAAVSQDIPNNHLGYALFWFSMAGLVVIFAFLLNRRAKENQS